jgi:hypothetical protein
MNKQAYLDIFDDEAEDTSVSNFEYVEYMPDNLVFTKDTKTWTIQHKNIDDFILPSRSYILVQGKVKKTDGSDFAPSDQVALVNNGYSVFERATYLCDGQPVEDIQNVPQCTLVKNLLDMSNDHRDSMGSLMNFYPDSGPGGAVTNKYTSTTALAGADLAHLTATTEVTDTANYNEGFHKRQMKSTDDKLISLFLPTKHLFGFAENEKVSRGVKHTLKLYRAEFEDMLMKASTLNETPVFNISKISWWMPIVRPSLPILSQLESKLQAGSIVPWNFRSIQGYKSDAMQSTSRTWRITTQAVKPTRVFIALQLAEKSGSLDHNNLTFDNVNLKSIHLRVNGKQFPQEGIETDYTDKNQDWARAYATFIQSSGKGFDPDTGCMVDYDTYGKLYPIYAFDLTTLDPSIFGSAADLEVRISHRSAPTDPCHIFAIVESEGKILFRGNGANRMVIEQI